VPTPSERSYRALLAVPSIGRVLTGMLVSRIADGMTAIALVLFTLQTFDDPALAGLVTFASIVPGLLLSPLAGALLDRHGRTRLIVLDLSVAASALWLIAILAATGALSEPLLVLIVVASSLTGPLSRTGLRSLFPILVPKHLWERVNAIDANGYVVATLVGPPAAAALVQFLGGPAALAIIGLVFATAAVILRRAPDPAMETASTGNLLRDAWDGLVYVVRNRTLLTLGIAMSTLNIGGGIVVLMVPLLVLEHLGGSETMVGLVFAAQGAAGMVAALFFGRVDTRGRERTILSLSMLAMAVVLGLLALPSIAAIALCMAFLGFFNGPMDVALFTIRQRRTDPAWTGRAFAVSMSLNFAGYPVGSLIAGGLGTDRLPMALGIAILATLVGALMAWFWIPARAPEPGVSAADASMAASAG
jgi:MFS family permease